MLDPVGDRQRRVEDDREAVMRFAEDMIGKLAANAHKAHWSTVTQEWLVGRLLRELSELVFALESGSVPSIRSECADVANFAMMISDNTR